MVIDVHRRWRSAGRCGLHGHQLRLLEVLLDQQLLQELLLLRRRQKLLELPQLLKLIHRQQTKLKQPHHFFNPNLWRLVFFFLTKR